MFYIKKEKEQEKRETTGLSAFIEIYRLRSKIHVTGIGFFKIKTLQIDVNFLGWIITPEKVRCQKGAQLQK